MSEPSRDRRFEREVRHIVVGGLLFLLFLSGLTLVLLRNVTAWAEREHLERLSAETRIVVERLLLSRDASFALGGDARVATLLRDAGARHAGLYDAGGDRLAEAPFLPDVAQGPETLAAGELPLPGETVAAGASSSSGPVFAVVTTSFAGGTRILRVGYDGSLLSDAERNVRILSFVVPLAAVTLGLMVIPFLRRLLSPIEALAETARDASGLLPEEPGRDEADRAISTFARTIEELRKRTTELDGLRRREKERADALAVTAETLVRSHPGGLLVIDADGELSEANEPARRLLDLPADAVGTRAILALASYPTLVEAVRGASGGEATLGREFVLGEETNGRRLVVTAAPVVDAANRPLGTLVFLEDRTRTNRLERELSARRELAALGEMSAGIAHEFRNATATLQGWARLAASTEDPKARARHLAAIRAEADHIATVTGDFLLFARPGRFTPGPVRLGDLAREIVEEERMADATIEVDAEGTFATVRGDGALLRRVLVNLVRNAREAAGTASSGGGRVVVLGEGESGGTARIAVEDDGAGVPAQIVPKLFVPFSSTKETGTGLGLALVAKIAALHGGSVAVERGRVLPGARFVLTLPVA